MAPGLSQSERIMPTWTTVKKILAWQGLGMAVLLTGCVSPGAYQIFYHQTFTRPGPFISGLPTGTGMPGQAIEVTGIYDLKDFRPDSLPVLQWCDSLRRPQTIYLSEPLPASTGSLVRVSGRWLADNAVRSGLVMLQPIDFQHLATTQRLRDHATSEYQRLRPKLELAITQPQSRLKLPIAPEWQLFWQAQTGALILRLGCADLMYAASIEFVYDFASRTLRQVYAHEYFKGE